MEMFTSTKFDLLQKAFDKLKELTTTQVASVSRVGQSVTDPTYPLVNILGFGLVRPITIFTLVTQWVPKIDID